MAAKTGYTNYTKVTADELDAVVLKQNGTAIGSGTGDVTGQASSVDNEIALFSGTGGKTIKRAATTGVLKAANGVIAAAVAGTDYVAPTDETAVRTAQVTLTAAQLKALYTSPQTIVAAPGPGKAIMVLGAIAKYTYATAAFSGGSSPALYINGYSGAGWAVVPAFTQGPGNALLAATADKMSYGFPAGGGADLANLSNQPLVFAGSAADHTAGGGSLTLTVRYMIVTV